MQEHTVTVLLENEISSIELPHNRFIEAVRVTKKDFVILRRSNADDKAVWEIIEMNAAKSHGFEMLPPNHGLYMIAESLGEGSRCPAAPKLLDLFSDFYTGSIINDKEFSRIAVALKLKESPEQKTQRLLEKRRAVKHRLLESKRLAIREIVERLTTKKDLVATLKFVRGRVKLKHKKSNDHL